LVYCRNILRCTDLWTSDLMCWLSRGTDRSSLLDFDFERVASVLGDKCLYCALLDKTQPLTWLKGFQLKIMCLGVLLRVRCHVVIAIKLKRVCPLGAWPKGDTQLSSGLKFRSSETKVSRCCLHTTIALLPVIKPHTYDNSSPTCDKTPHIWQYLYVQWSPRTHFQISKSTHGRNFYEYMKGLVREKRGRPVG
jgi:hypothetical protein